MKKKLFFIAIFIIRHRSFREPTWPPAHLRKDTRADSDGVAAKALLRTAYRGTVRERYTNGKVV